MISSPTSQKWQLLLGTVSFTVCFAAWGLVSAFAPRFRQLLHLTATQTAFLVAVPVLLGALARIPMGMLTDRFGGRLVFTVLMFSVAIPVALVPAATDYQSLLAVGSSWGWRAPRSQWESGMCRAGSRWKTREVRWVSTVSGISDSRLRYS